MPATYLDHAATTAMRPAAVEAMAAVMAQVGNASSLHTSGRRARRLVEESRERVAAALGARPSEVVFTSGGTEADNLAIAGVFRARREADPRRRRLVVPRTEHRAVLDTVSHLLDHEGAQVSWVECDEDGYVDPAAVAAAIGADPGDVALVSVMWANNEVGTVQPVEQIAEVAHQVGVPFHTDAVQAVPQLPVDVGASRADLLALSGHKVGGPTGIGALVVASGTPVQPTSHGGGQERQLRSGTVPVASIVGLATALEETVRQRPATVERLTELRDTILLGAVAVPGVRVRGRWTPGDARHRLAGNAHLTVDGCAGDSLLYLLDAAGVECSTGSACHAGLPQPSHVLLAMGLSPQQARGALRVTLGHPSTQADAEAFLAALPQAVERARRADGPARQRAGTDRRAAS